ncbi:plant UBX domain-containing protein 11 [Ziziphus jujuba]|uniref:Plant UBX domain-containing protein 11 n=1 Tax=Ziziphus jujuba TaxID=326968 RepID=A0A6P4AM11_ZIZJJ|nr:plant UBX domain-containing protein 11 [Ziziphus jujuba]
MEQSLSTLAYKGSIPEAINVAKNEKKLFVVYISGKDSESSQLENSTWTDPKVAESVSKYCILLHIPEGGADAAQFSAIYPQKSIPCITAVGYNGLQLWQNEGFVSAEVLASSLEKVWLSLHIQETTVTVLSAALASKKSETSTSGVSSMGSEQGSSASTIALSPSTGKNSKLPESTREANSSTGEENESRECTVEAKGNELGSVISSKLIDTKEVESTSEKSNSSNEATKELQCPATVDFENAVAHRISSSAEDSSPALEKDSDNHSVSIGGSQTEATVVMQDEKGDSVDDKKNDAFDNATTVKKLNDVHLNIRIPNGANLQEKFSVTSTLRRVKDYVDQHQTSVVGSYDLAIPYPRKVFDDQDLCKTLSELGLYDRQALIVVPHRLETDQPRPTTINSVDSSNESNGGYFAYVKRIFSFINPFSYLGGDSSSTSSGEQSQNGLWEYSPNATLQSNLNQAGSRSTSGTSRNDDKGRKPTTSRFGSNIHTLKHDEDDGRFNDRNSFWNGNSTQYGGGGGSDNDGK